MSSELLICEYNGTARSGKGTIVRHLADVNPGAAIEETGRDYRTVTRVLLDKGVIGESQEGLQAAIEKLGPGELDEIIASRDELISQLGRDSLYSGEINRLVSKVGEVGLVRQAVKSGLRNRVEAMVLSSETKLLLLDGRELCKVVEGIRGATILLRSFVTCRPLEAALRECERNGISLNSREGRKILEDIEMRDTDDKQRAIDPVKQDAEAIDYWLASHFYREPAVQELLAAKTAEEYLAAAQSAKQESLVVAPALGTGELAVRTHRQILFDTTPFRALANDSLAGMLNSADIMLKEALANQRKT